MSALPLHLVGVATGQRRRQYVYGLLLMLPAILAAGAAVILIAGKLPGDHPYVSSYAMLLSLILAIPIIAWLWRMVHGLPALMLVAPGRRFDAGMLVRSGLVFGLPLLLHFLYGLWNDELRPAPVDWGPFLGLLPVTILAFTLQAGAEELLFRSYLLQAFRRWFGHVVPAAIVASLLFVAAHEGTGMRAVWAMRADILLIALFCCWITVRTGRLEAAIGIHAVNNILVTLLAHQPDLPLPHLLERVDPDPPDFQSLLEIAQFAGVQVASLGFYWLAGLRSGFVERGLSPHKA